MSNRRDDERDRLEPARALLHPAWLGAFAVLLLNDHVLKATLEMPWVTGKLSDVAGLLVAPVLLAAILRVRRLRGVVLSALAVGAVFAAINLSPAAAGLWDGAMATVGFEWVTHTDPTDCLALGVLPFSILIFITRMREPWHHPTERVAAAGLALAGLLGCAASGPPPDDPQNPEFSARLALLNKTHELQVFQIRQLDDTISADCDRVAEAPQEYLRAEAFGEPVRWELFSGQRIPVTTQGSDIFRTEPPPVLGEDECRATRITLETADDIIVFWGGELEPKMFRHRAEKDKGELGGAQTIALTGDYSDADDSEVREFGWQPCLDDDRCGREGRQAAAEIPEGASYAWQQQGDGTRHFYPIPGRTERARDQAPRRCRNDLERAGLAWEPIRERRWCIQGLERGEDGCHLLELRAPDRMDGADSEPTRRLVCAPWSAMRTLSPVGDGKHVFVEPEAFEQPGEYGGLQIDYQVQSDEGNVADTGTVALLYGTAVEELVVEGAEVEPKEGCGPIPAACGQAEVAGELTIGSSSAPLTAGESAPISEQPEASVHLMRAFERPVVRTNDSCGADDAPVAASFPEQPSSYGYLEVAIVADRQGGATP